MLGAPVLYGGHHHHDSDRTAGWSPHLRNACARRQTPCCVPVNLNYWSLQCTQDEQSGREYNASDGSDSISKRQGIFLIFYPYKQLKVGWWKNKRYFLSLEQSLIERSLSIINMIVNFIYSNEELSLVRLHLRIGYNICIYLYIPLIRNFLQFVIFLWLLERIVLSHLKVSLIPNLRVVPCITN